MLHDIAFALWYFLPAAFANGAPPPIAKIPGIRKWDAPIDGGRTYRGRPILGLHKTWRGIVAGIVMATLVFWLEQMAVRHFGWAQRLTVGHDYSGLPTLILGPLFAIGALGGDALESFFKRQLGKRSGGTWFPFDQLDYIVGGTLLTAPFILLSLGQYVWLVVLWFGLHLLISYLGYLVHIKDEPL